MIRHTHRRDENEAEIVNALEAIGCAVYRIGRPVDLLVGYRAKNYLLEIKNRDGLNKLTKEQEKFIPSWKGQVRIVYTAEEDIELVTEAYEST